MKKKASIIIRTHNEEDWIAHCLKSIKKQNYKNYEIILIDNNSTDNTVIIAKKLGVDKVVKIKKFFPGKALNAGCKIAKGEFLVLLSAHCVPVDDSWLKNLLINFKNKNVAAVYGKQSPITYSKPEDIRDLYITFGNERRIQKKDNFFHNANSAIRKSVWSKYNFDNKLSNIEDRDWSKKIIEKKYWIVYEPTANVFHYHGIHHSRNEKRLKNTIKVIEKIEDNNFLKLPDTLKPNKIKLLIIINYPNYIDTKTYNKIFVEECKKIDEIKFNKKILLVKPKTLKKKIISDDYFILNNYNKSNLNEILKKSVKKSFKNDYFPDFILYLNIEYIFRSRDMIAKIINRACLGGYDTIIPSIKNFSTNFIYNNKKNEYEVFGKDLKNRSEKTPIFTGYYGLGTIVKTKVASRGALVSDEKNGLYIIKKNMETLRINELEKNILKKYML